MYIKKFSVENIFYSFFTKTFWDDEALNSKLQIMMNLNFILTRKFKLFEQLFSFRTLDDSSSPYPPFWGTACTYQ